MCLRWHLWSGHYCSAPAEKQLAGEVASFSSSFLQKRSFVSSFCSEADWNWDSGCEWPRFRCDPPEEGLNFESCHSTREVWVALGRGSVACCLRLLLFDEKFQPGSEKSSQQNGADMKKLPWSALFVVEGYVSSPANTIRFLFKILFFWDKSQISAFFYPFTWFVKSILSLPCLKIDLCSSSKIPEASHILICISALNLESLSPRPEKYEPVSGYDNWTSVPILIQKAESHLSTRKDSVKIQRL